MSPNLIIHGLNLGFSGPATGVIWALGPKVAKRVRNEFPGPLGPEGPKSPKTESKNGSKSTIFQTIWIFFNSVFDFFRIT